MAEAILKYNLPEENDEFHYAVNGLKYLSVLDELDQWVRNQAKYYEKYQFSDEEIRNRIRELMEELGISLQDLK